jgi:general secretion pathway protein D
LQQKRALETGSVSKKSPRRGQTTSSVVAFPKTNQVAVIVEPWNKAEVLNFVKILDLPSDAKKQMYRFAYISPARVMKLVDSVLGEEFKGRYQSAYDDESGILLVSGPEKLHVQIEALKNELDVSENDPLHREIKFYVVKNAIATDVLTTIQSLDLGTVFSESLLGQETVKSGLAAESFAGPNIPPPALGKPLPKPPVFRGADAVSKTPLTYKSDSDSYGSEESLTVVTADLNTNTIIVIAPDAIQEMYAKLIKELDKRRPQVLVEVTMVTLDKTDSLNLGIELLNAGTIGAADYLMFSSFGLSTPDITTGSLALNPGTGFNGTVINAGAFSAVVRALATNTHAKVVSSPRILVNDNAEAMLTSIQEQPFTSVNASETVSTTSFAGYASAGSTLSVTPHISEGEHLNLKYTVTLNSFSGEASGGVPAPRQTNELTSEVTVPDGYVVVVGGLKRHDTSRTKSKVPFLGDIPYLGELFSRTDDSDSESVLFVFIRPIILRDDEFESLKYLSDVELEKAQMSKNYPDSYPLIMN